jgi:hypothetical protein
MKEKVRELLIDGKDALVVFGGKGAVSKALSYVMLTFFCSLPGVALYFLIEVPQKAFVLIFVSLYLFLYALGVFVLLIEEMEMTIVDGGYKLVLHQKTPFRAKDVILDKKEVGAFMIRPCRIGFRYNLVLECAPNEKSILPKQFPVGYAYGTIKEFEVISKWLQHRVDGIKIQSAN